MNIKEEHGKLTARKGKKQRLASNEVIKKTIANPLSLKSKEKRNNSNESAKKGTQALRLKKANSVINRRTN